MAFYFNLPSKFERAVRAFLITQGKDVDAVAFQANGDIFVSNDSRTRDTFPNRTCVVLTNDPIRPHRPEGVLHLQIQHHFDATMQPDETNFEAARLKADVVLAATADTLGVGDDNEDQAMSELADAITAAGQWLATPDPTQQNPEVAAIEEQIVANNADIVNFRCDWIRRAHPFHTRGSRDGDALVWVEILNFEAACSYANIPN